MDRAEIARRAGGQGYVYHAKGSFLALGEREPSGLDCYSANDTPGERASLARGRLTHAQVEAIDDGQRLSFKVGTVAVEVRDAGDTIILNGHKAHEHGIDSDDC